MIVHFICRGNAFRSIIAEAYLNSLRFENLKAMSSGTVAAAEKAGNQAAFTETLGFLARNGIREFVKTSYGDQLTQSRLTGTDVIICMNQIVYDECQQLVVLPPGTRIWSVADIGEPGRSAHTEPEKNLREEAYYEIVEGISQLISELLMEDVSSLHLLEQNHPVSRHSHAAFSALSALKLLPPEDR